MLRIVYLIQASKEYPLIRYSLGSMNIMDGKKIRKRINKQQLINLAHTVLLPLISIVGIFVRIDKFPNAAKWYDWLLLFLLVDLSIFYFFFNTYGE